MDSTPLALPYGVYRLEDLAEKGIGIGRVEPPHDEHQVRSGSTQVTFPPAPKA